MVAMKILLLNMILLIALASCDDNKTMPADSRLTLVRSVTGFNAVINENNEDRGDPVNIQAFSITGDSAYITLSYPGGCSRHTFEVIWSETYSQTYPPATDLLVIHDAHDDACEALITETISFDMGNLTGPVDYEKVTVNIFNGNMPATPASTAQWNPSDINVYQVGFPEGDRCQIEVTAMEAICGVGLWDDMWFALNDSVTAGVEGSYFRKWLQPVAVTDNLQGFKPVEGKKYLVGARVRKEHPYDDIVTCLAYPGPSVPVLITCISELK